MVGFEHVSAGLRPVSAQVQKGSLFTNGQGQYVCLCNYTPLSNLQTCMRKCWFLIGAVAGRSGVPASVRPGYSWYYQVAIPFESGDQSQILVRPHQLPSLKGMAHYYGF